MERQASEVRERIVGGVIAVISSSGIRKLTHRRVASVAGVSLASTTYHFRSKADMLAVASEHLLQDYITRFRRLAGRYRRDDDAAIDIEQLGLRLVVGALGSQRDQSLAWFEIILDAARTKEGRERARRWFDDLAECWRTLPLSGRSRAGRFSNQSIIDTVIGLTLIGHALGIDNNRMLQLYEQKRGLAASLGENVHSPAMSAEPTAGSKARDTRKRIIDAAIAILMDQGASALSYRAIALKTEMTQSAPSYYFSSIDEIFREAQVELFHRSKDRYRSWSPGIGTRVLSADELTDLTMAIYTREATEFAASSLALYSIWHEAARNIALRAEVRSAVLDQAEAWHRRLGAIRKSSTYDGFSIQAMFIGGLIRTVACGSDITEISNKRADFMFMIAHGIEF